ncbi:uncharacterized protein LOC131594011 [Vicia villosa]|uniref:uncharacterized protein LOC131594011 n=1 Tax=Vicia villosa TaxID=3911 RepID=UPI00273C32AE|nr:uncharacterized protein LOC131594011 [Vicia villosa]
MWAIKVVLKAFELVSGLGINYNKSKLIGINVGRGFLEAASNSLACKVEESNFFFLGILVGFNPRKYETWSPLISKMKNQLVVWKNRFSINNGFRTPFWESVWLDGRVLKVEFPALFEASALKGVAVAAMGGWVDGKWVWGDIGIAEHLLSNGAILVEWEEIGNLLVDFGDLVEDKDGVEGDLNSGEGFSVASCYTEYASKHARFVLFVDFMRRRGWFGSRTSHSR